MAVAAVYLDHHWVIDVIAGWVVAVVAVLIAGWCLRRLKLQLRQGALLRPDPTPLDPRTGGVLDSAPGRSGSPEGEAAA
jgi:hypothetical protein